MSCPLKHRLPMTQQGVVLPMALILLIIISFAGLLAARNSATYEQFSNNMRTNQVSRVAAEDALRQCERIAKDSVDASVGFPTTLHDKIVATEIASDEVADIKGGAWNFRANWADDSNSLIQLSTDLSLNDKYGDHVASTPNGKTKNDPRLKNSPTCIIQKMSNERFLVTARGLSSDAEVDQADGDRKGMLKSGSEVWLQSILTPGKVCKDFEAC